MSAPPVVRSYAVSYRNTPGETIVAATSPGRAKARVFPDWKEIAPDCDFTGLRVRVLPYVVSSENFKRCLRYRGIPFAYIGMRVEVGGQPGVIVGHNGSANLDVEFTSGEWTGQVLNCHPHSEIRYFDDGQVIADFTKKPLPLPEGPKA